MRPRCACQLDILPFKKVFEITVPVCGGTFLATSVTIDAWLCMLEIVVLVPVSSLACRLRRIVVITLSGFLFVALANVFDLAKKPLSAFSIRGA